MPKDNNIFKANDNKYHDEVAGFDGVKVLRAQIQDGPLTRFLIAREYDEKRIFFNIVDHKGDLSNFDHLTHEGDYICFLTPNDSGPLFLKQLADSLNSQEGPINRDQGPVKTLFDFFEDHFIVDLKMSRFYELWKTIYTYYDEIQRLNGILDEHGIDYSKTSAEKTQHAKDFIDLKGEVFLVGVGTLKDGRMYLQFEGPGDNPNEFHKIRYGERHTHVVALNAAERDEFIKGAYARGDKFLLEYSIPSVNYTYSKDVPDIEKAVLIDSSVISKFTPLVHQQDNVQRVGYGADNPIDPSQDPRRAGYFRDFGTFKHAAEKACINTGISISDLLKQVKEGQLADTHIFKDPNRYPDYAEFCVKHMPTPDIQRISPRL